jgi:hypothetical protein
MLIVTIMLRLATTALGSLFIYIGGEAISAGIISRDLLDIPRLFSDFLPRDIASLRQSGVFGNANASVGFGTALLSVLLILAGYSFPFAIFNWYKGRIERD